MIRVGSRIEYDWWKGSVQWKVIDSYDSEVTKTIDGTRVTRKWETWNKALYIETDSGDTVLKSENEVKKI